MKKNNSILSVIKDISFASPLLSAAMIASLVASVAFALLPPLLLGDIVDSLSQGAEALVVPALLYFAALAASGLLDALKEIMITKYGQRITKGMRKFMCNKLSFLPASYFSRNEAGKISSCFVNDVDTVEALFTGGIVSMAADACKVISIIVVIFLMSPGLGILMLLITPAIFFFTRFIQRRMLKAQLKNRLAVARVNNHVPETLKNIRIIRSTSSQKYMEDRYDGFIDESYTATEKSNFCDAIYSPVIMFVSAAVVSVMMILSAAGGDFRTFFGMSVGTAVAVIAYVGKVFAPIESIGMEIQNIQSALAGIKRINEFLSEPEKRPTDDSIDCSKLSVNDATALEFKNLSFSYIAGRQVLEDISFKVGKGENVTIIGRTGAGKSTVFRLLLGMYEPDSGEALVFGKEAALIPDSGKRELFGYVEQSFRMVPGTVAEQISLFDESISPEDIERAAALVGLDKYISALPNGFDTSCRSEMFSRGQFQLLSIARAVVKNPPVMLLDEITANLDSATEEQIINAIDRASKSRTVISVSHRIYEKTGRGRLISI